MQPPYLNKSIIIVLTVFILLFWLYKVYPMLFCRFVENPKWRPYENMVADVNANDIRAVKRDLDNGVDPNAIPNDTIALSNESDMAALCVAADNGNVAMVNLLLDYKADPNINDGWYHSPLESAAANDHIEVMKVLIQRGAHINDENGNSEALWRASVDGKIEAVKFLLSHQANPNTKCNTSKMNDRLIDVSKGFHQDEVVKLLIKAGAKE